jgi:hypothetical protein
MRGADIYTGRREKRVKKGVRTLFGNAKRWFSLARLEKRILTPFFTSFARHFSSLSRYIGMVWLLVLTLVSLPDGAPDRTELDAQFAEQLESLASKCDELKLPELAQATRTWRVSAPGDRNLLYIAPEADPLAIDESWSFTTAAPPGPGPDEGPGGPVLVIAKSTNPFSRYYGQETRAYALALLLAGWVAATSVEDARAITTVVVVTHVYLGVAALSLSRYDGAWGRVGALSSLLAATLFVASTRAASRRAEVVPR